MSAPDVRVSAKWADALAMAAIALAFIAGLVWIEIAGLWETGAFAERLRLASSLDSVAPYWHWLLTAVGAFFFLAAATAGLRSAGSGALMWTEEDHLYVRGLARNRRLSASRIIGVSVAGSEATPRLAVGLTDGTTVSSLRIGPESGSWETAADELNSWLTDRR